MIWVLFINTSKYHQTICAYVRMFVQKLKKSEIKLPVKKHPALYFWKAGKIQPFKFRIEFWSLFYAFRLYYKVGEKNTISSKTNFWLPFLNEKSQRHGSHIFPLISVWKDFLYVCVCVSVISIQLPSNLADIR